MICLFEKEIQVHFGDTDPQGILYFARAFEYAHAGLEEFVSASSLGWNYWFKNPEFAVPIKNASCDFKLPMKAGETYKLKLSVLSVGESSLNLNCIFQSMNDEECASVSMVHVFVDRKTFRKISVPDNVRLLFTKTVA